MTNRYLVDSSAWVEYFAGTELGKEIKDIIEKEEIATCILSIAELSDKFSREKEKFDASLSFIKNKSVILDITLSSCIESGKLKAERRKIKKDFGLVDAIIYLTAKESHCILIARDDDFKGMENVIVLEK